MVDNPADPVIPSIFFMKKRIVIIDGYNAIHRVTELRNRLEKSLASAREGLVEYCSRWLSARRDFSEFMIVFDGDSSVMPSDSGGCGVRVIFTRTKEEADDRILTLVKDGCGNAALLVVSSDNYVSGNAKRHGARTMSVSDFFGMMTAGRKSFAKQDGFDGCKRLSPAEERKINESLKKEWGLE